MGIGGSIFLIAVGAIIAFALDVQVGWLDLAVVGWVLMLAGVAALVLTLMVWNNRRRTVVTSSAAPPVERRVFDETAAPPVVERRVYNETTEVDPRY